MATLSAADSLTPIEVAKRFGLKDQINIIEALSITDQLLLDAAIFEASDGTLNKTTSRVSMPAGTLRIYGEGITTHGSQTRQIEDSICMLEDYSEVDVDMANHSPNKAALLDSEDKAFLMGMGQTVCKNVFYGNKSTDPKSINGFSVRYPKLVAGSVMSGGGTLDAGTSAWLVRWGKNSAHLFYPRGHEGLGITRKFLGEQTVNPTAGTKMQAYSTFFSVHFGLSVRDPRCVKRIANIKSDCAPDTVLLPAIVTLKNKMPPGEGNLVLYCNATVKTIFDIYAVKQAYGCRYTDDQFGKPVTMFQDIRIRQIDELIDTEQTLV